MRIWSFSRSTLSNSSMLSPVMRHSKPKPDGPGIGRPSTYASILKVLQDRDYVTLEKRRFTPEDRGRLVTAFLTNFFRRYVEYGFTADMEEQLDDIYRDVSSHEDVLMAL